eukprot:Blabericola_migrator_1__7159@NODE_362_length_9426_cov_300_827118_g290_i0_p1_GENE_NODE_362_length_9426_cov_300_827118_g290_i0NODE_362_length_9426_cov_300_827118_g290_i0_p1_ORF_typecomplete_len1321_score261_61Patched/PF02460_18/5_2e03Patched/PF02460_18/7_3e100Sterolsensing/PF12349_8/9e23Sterolsensing/PF12349_8/1_3e04Sterolsensing/PF12349_8/1_5MMPL/PF03176_15/3_7e08MMPL/PF03176_15/4_9e03MMPL/PF03176_15/1_3e09ACR_tran/PF00873_19/11ACR_tran/PF00873_19/7_6e09SecD_SecF/PF02355_16/2_3e05SecD_SecF/PF0235
MRQQSQTITHFGSEGVSTMPASKAAPKPSFYRAFSARKDRCLKQVEDFFMWAGGFIFDHAIWFICGSSFVVLVCALSFLFIHFESRADLLYALPASLARSDLAKLATLFGPPPRVNMVFVVSAANETILNPPVLKKVKQLDDYIKHQLVSHNSHDGSSYSYQEVCHRMLLPDVNFSAVAEDDVAARAMDLPDCYSMGPLDMYRSERQFGVPLATRNWPYIPNVAANKIIKADLALTDPGIIRLPSGTTRLFNATGFLFLYHTAADTPEKLSKSLQWETALIKFINHRIKPYAHKAKYTVLDQKLDMDVVKMDYDGFMDSDWSEYQVFVNAQRSWQDELGRSTSFDKRLMRDYLLAYLIIASYMIIANRTSNLVRSKAFCGFIGSLSAVFGFAFGGGLCYWAGLRHTPTMHASPFLVLGIGLDNTFVVLNFYTLAHAYTKDPRKRCQMALREAGLSITNTTCTSIISFLVGAAGPYLAVRNFCLITALGLFGGWLMNIVFAFPFLCLEAVAESEGRISFLPWPLSAYKLLPDFLIPPETKIWIARQEQGEEKFRRDPFQPAATSTTETLFTLSGESNQATKPRSTPSTSPHSHVRTDGFMNSTSEEEPQPTFGPPQPPPSASDSDVFGTADAVAGGTQGLLTQEVTSASSADTAVSITTSADALKSYLKHNLFQADRSIHELASIQWTFEKRKKEFAKALTRKGDAHQASSGCRRRKILPPTDDDDEDAGSYSSCGTTEVPSYLEVDPSTLDSGTIQKYVEFTDVCCKAIDEPSGNVGKRSRSVFLHKLGPAATTLWVQTFIMVSMVAFIAVSLFGAFAYLKAGLNLENLTPPDSYLREAFHLSRDKFPIFPYETNVFFTAPKRLPIFDDNVAERKAILKSFTFDRYGVRNPNTVAALSPYDDDSAHVGVGGDVPKEESERYWNSLGEVPWWEPETFVALQDVDTKLRNMMNTQDVLNGMLLFFNEKADRIFTPGSTPEQRRITFYTELYSWLRSGVVGQLVRNHFRFADPDPDDPTHMPRLLGYRLTCFNFNFLNSFEQSQYMVNVRKECSAVSQDWKVILLDEDEQDLEGLGITDGYPHMDKKAPTPALKKIKIEPDNAHSWFSVTPFMETFIYFESDVSILRSTIINMATAFVAIVLVSSLLMRGVGTAVLVTLMICFVDLGIFGFMGFWSIHLNILSMILLVLSIGFSVDYTVHVVHTFTHCPGRTRRDKTVETLILMCNPVTHGALSTMLGICPIGFRNEFIMETFFKMTILVVSFGFLHGVIFLPIILSLKGPRIVKTEQKGVELRKFLTSVVQPLAIQATATPPPCKAEISDSQ